MPSIVGTDPFGGARSISEGLITVTVSILSISFFSFALEGSQYRAESIRQSFDLCISVRCCIAFIDPRLPSHLFSNCGKRLDEFVTVNDVLVWPL